jgi:osmoprotectant transport system substrate-binding protein
VAVTASAVTTLPQGEPLSFEVLPAGEAPGEALSDGRVDIAVLFSTSADIASNGWVLLEDDRGLQNAENVTPLLRSGLDADVVGDALAPVSAALTTAELTGLNSAVSARTPEEVAQSWLSDQGLLEVDDAAALSELSLTVGSFEDTESEIIAELYKLRLESLGAEVTAAFRFGSRSETLPALESGDLDLVPEYLSSLILYYTPTAVIPVEASEVEVAAPAGAADAGLTLLDPAPAEVGIGFVVTGETADRLGLSAVSDLRSVDEALTLGGPSSCPTEISCLAGLAEVYDIPLNE